MQKGQYFDGVARPPTRDPHQFLANRDSRSKLRQYNIEGGLNIKGYKLV